MKSWIYASSIVDVRAEILHTIVADFEHIRDDIIEIWRRRWD
jgi:hypothetical protein